MSGVRLGLAPVPLSVERHLSGGPLGRETRAFPLSEFDEAGSRQSRDRLEGGFEPRLLRLHESNVAEELACFLDVERPDATLWEEQMRVAIARTFAGDLQRTEAALHGLEAARAHLLAGPGPKREAASGELDALLYALSIGAHREKEASG